MALLGQTTPRQPRLYPADARQAPLFAFGLLTAASALASFVFACATPFAAFAVIAAAMLPLRPALLVVTGTWLVNQGIGYGVLHYPINANSIAWGLALGLASLAATAAAKTVLNASARMAMPAALAIALAAAYAIYEVALLALTPFLGGTEGFTMDIVLRIDALNALEASKGVGAGIASAHIGGRCRERHEFIRRDADGGAIGIDMGVEIDQAGRHQLALGVDTVLGTIGRNAGLDGHDLAEADADVADAAQIHAGIDDLATADHEIILLWPLLAIGPACGERAECCRTACQHAAP